MGRKLRNYKANTYYHVYNRGNNGDVVFRSHLDNKFFIKNLYRYANRYGVRVEAYCIMRTHYHLILKTGARYPDLSLMMQMFLSKYSRYVNRTYNRFGYVFQGRYQAKKLDTEGDLERVKEYLRQNPVKKKYVQKPEDYRWLRVL